MLVWIFTGTGVECCGVGTTSLTGTDFCATFLLVVVFLALVLAGAAVFLLLSSASLLASRFFKKIAITSSKINGIT